MKKALTLIFGMFVATAAMCQNPLAEVEIIRQWNSRRDIPATPGTSYQWFIPGDTAYYFTPIPGKKIRATITFTEVTSQPQPDIVLNIDNLPGPGLTYSPATNLGLNVVNPNGWYHFQSAGSVTWPDPAFNKSFSVLGVPGFLEIDFTGYKFEWFSEKRINHGIASVHVDGIKVADVDLYGNTTANNSQQVFSWQDPAAINKAHKIRISFTGTKNTAATETNIIHDYVKTYRKP